MHPRVARTSELAPDAMFAIEQAVGSGLSFPTNMMHSHNMIPTHGSKPLTRPRLPSPRRSLCPAALSIVAACALAVSCGKKDEKPAPSAQPDSKGTNLPATASARPEFAKLAGKWERPDGGYVLEIKTVDSGGTMDAAYFNPNPIKVSRAAAFSKEGATKVVVELRDENYPGCTYNLTYDPQSDQLYGQYFQASMQQTFDVTFARMK